MAVRIRRVASQPELTKAFIIRRRVFIDEQGVPAEIEMDSDDKRALHFLAFDRSTAVGTARLVLRKGVAKIGRMAVLKSHRRKGIGNRLLHRAILAAQTAGAKKIYLHAQVSVIPFYEAAGFQCVGRIFIEAGIPHRKMTFIGGNR